MRWNCFPDVKHNDSFRPVYTCSWTHTWKWRQISTCTFVTQKQTAPEPTLLGFIYRDLMCFLTLTLEATPDESTAWPWSPHPLTRTHTQTSCTSRYRKSNWSTTAAASVCDAGVLQHGSKPHPVETVRQKIFQLALAANQLTDANTPTK